MKKIETLTAAQIAKFPDYVAEWKAHGLSTERANRPRAESAIKAMYAGAGLAEPQILWTESPLGNAVALELFKSLPKAIGSKKKDSVGASVWASVWDSVRDSVGASVRDSVWASVRDSVGASVRDSVWASVGASVRDSVGASVRDSVGASVRDSVWASVWDSVGASVWDSVWDSVGASVWASVRDSVRDSVWASVRASVRASVYGQHDASWLAFYKFFHTECGLVDQTKKLHALWELCQSAGWALPYEKVCFVSDRHSICRLDDRGLIHCEDGPAIRYEDGFEIFAWHGTRIPGEWITNRETLTPTLALTHPNIEQRRAAIGLIGWNSVLTQLKAKTIDRDNDPEIGELIEADIPDVGRERFLKVRCGTGRFFCLPVPPEMSTALQAQSWTWGHDTSTFLKPEVRT